MKLSLKLRKFFILNYGTKNFDIGFRHQLLLFSSDLLRGTSDLFKKVDLPFLYQQMLRVRTLVAGNKFRVTTKSCLYPRTRVSFPRGCRRLFKILVHFYFDENAKSSRRFETYWWCIYSSVPLSFQSSFGWESRSHFWIWNRTVGCLCTTGNAFLAIRHNVMWRFLIISDLDTILPYWEQLQQSWKALFGPQLVTSSTLNGCLPIPSMLQERCLIRILHFRHLIFDASSTRLGSMVELKQIVRYVSLDKRSHVKLTSRQVKEEYMQIMFWAKSMTWFMGLILAGLFDRTRHWFIVLQRLFHNLRVENICKRRFAGHCFHFIRCLLLVFCTCFASVSNWLYPFNRSPIPWVEFLYSFGAVWDWSSPTAAWAP